MHALIDDSAAVFTLINTFDVAPEKQQAVVASLRNFTERHAQCLRGFIGASVHASLDGRRVVNYVQWDDKSCLDAMLITEEAKAHVAESARWRRMSIRSPIAWRLWGRASVLRNRLDLATGLCVQLLLAITLHGHARAQAGSPFRYDDDVSAYASPGAHVSLYDDLKYVPLGDGAGDYLSYGGNLRERVEVNSNALLGFGINTLVARGACRDNLLSNSAAVNVLIGPDANLFSITPTCQPVPPAFQPGR